MDYEVSLADVGSPQLDGARWEIYGPHDDDPAQQWTEVYWLLR